MDKLLIAFTAILFVAGCDIPDDNNVPSYSKETGLAVNCRAYVQVVINGYRSRQYTAEQSFDSLERNCGINGYSWKNNRN